MLAVLATWPGVRGCTYASQELDATRETCQGPTPVVWVSGSSTPGVGVSGSSTPGVRVSGSSTPLLECLRPPSQSAAELNCPVRVPLRPRACRNLGGESWQALVWSPGASPHSLENQDAFLVIRSS